MISGNYRNKFSLLTRQQRRLFATGFVAGVIMLANTIYLLLSSHVAGIGNDPESLPVFYQWMLVLHLVLGVAFVLLALVFVVLHVRKIYRRLGKRPWMPASGVVLIGSLLLLMLSGFFILSESNSRENFWIFVSHQVLAALLLGGYTAHRFLSRIKPDFVLLSKGVFAAAGLLAAVVLIYAFDTGIAAANAVEKPAAASYPAAANLAEDNNSALLLVKDLLPFKAAGDANPHSPFFPATTTTATRGLLPARILTHDDLPDLHAFHAETEAHGFAPNYYLGAQSCARCHADIVQQWSTSAHRFSSFNNPFYRRSVELTREKISKESSQFCGGCHDPAVMLAGNMVKEIDPLTPESQAGLTCLSCHAIDSLTHSVTGNGNYNIHDKTESPYIFDQAKSGIGLYVHDYVLKAKPTVHKQRNLKEVFHQSEFCLPCHKVNLDKPVNNYRWLRGQNEYDAWYNSGVARNQPMTFYEPPTVRQCQDCHMPLEETVLGDVAADSGKVRSHRFLAVNTALPALRGDTETIRRMEEFLRNDQLRLEIFAVKREDGSVIMSARDHAINVNPGEIIQIDVVVRNLNVGHTFPGGTNDSNEGWIDFKASLGDKKVFHNGFLREDKHVDPAAHFYKAVLIDRHGERINKRNASDIFTTVYANVIGPSTSDIARYRFRVPENAEGQQLKIDSRLMWRKFNREYTEFVFEGQEVPDLPITEIETDSLTLNVARNVQTLALSPLPEDAKRWMRYNDYGIGSLLDTDTRSALMAFAKVVELQPAQMDGYLNQARAHLAEGTLHKAEQMLRRASEVAPDQPRLAFFWGLLLQNSGRLDESINAFQRTLQSYPKSRDTWANLGRVYWLAGRWEDSIKAYTEVLEIDPEQAQAYHQLNLAFKALAANASDPTEREKYQAAAVEFEKGFEKYKIDEDAAVVTHRYREKNSHDNRMSQTIVIHEEG